jgi:hypothetical protein
MDYPKEFQNLMIYIRIEIGLIVVSVKNIRGTTNQNREDLEAKRKEIHRERLEQVNCFKRKQ